MAHAATITQSKGSIIIAFLIGILLGVLITMMTTSNSSNSYFSSSNNQKLNLVSLCETLNNNNNNNEKNTDVSSENQKNQQQEKVEDNRSEADSFPPDEVEKKENILRYFNNNNDEDKTSSSSSIKSRASELERSKMIRRKKRANFVNTLKPRFPIRGARLEKSLKEMVKLYGKSSLTDKFTLHDYAPMYEKVLQPYLDKKQKFKLLEVGLGCVPGYFNQAGLGFRFLKHYAKNMLDYYGLDISPCNFSHLGAINERYLTGKVSSSSSSNSNSNNNNNVDDGIENSKKKTQHHQQRIFQASQVDTDALDQINSQKGPFDVIIDDGSHMSHHIVSSFTWLFPNALRPGGVYCVEDLSAAFIPMSGHSRQAQADRLTSVNWIQNLIAQLHFPFHWKYPAETRTYKDPISGKQRTTKINPLSEYLDPYVHPEAKFYITQIVRQIRDVSCDREICCFTKMDTAPNATHRFQVPCYKDICEIPQEFLRP